MILRIFFTPAEIRKFFEDNGFEIVQGTFGKWGPTYHNRDEWNEYTANAVRIDGKYVEAAKLFERVAEVQLKQLMVPTSNNIQNTIKTVFQDLLNHN